MRIAMMADFYYPHVSGVTCSIDLSREVMLRRGHEVSVFTFGPPQPLDSLRGVVRSPGIPRGIPYGDARIDWGIRCSREARRRLETMDLIHVHHPFSSAVVARRHRRGSKVPIVFTWHTRYDLHLTANLPPALSWLTAPLMRRWLQVFCRDCAAIVTPSESLQGLLRRDLGAAAESIRTIPNGIDVGTFRCSREARWLRHDRAQKGGFRLVYVGRLGREKRLDRLLSSFASLAEDHVDATLVIVGGGPEAFRLRQMSDRLGIENRVVWTGELERSRIPGILADADLFVTPSESEVHPLAIMEAMAAGLPVAGVRGPALAELVEHGTTGLLVAPDDPSGLFEIIRAIIESPAMRRRLGRNAARKAGEFSIEGTVSRLLDLYGRCLSSAPVVQGKGGSERRTEKGKGPEASARNRREAG